MPKEKSKSPERAGASKSHKKRKAKSRNTLLQSQARPQLMNRGIGHSHSGSRSIPYRPFPRAMEQRNSSRQGAESVHSGRSVRRTPVMIGNVNSHLDRIWKAMLGRPGITTGPIKSSSGRSVSSHRRGNVSTRHNIAPEVEEKHEFGHTNAEYSPIPNQPNESASRQLRTVHDVNTTNTAGSPFSLPSTVGTWLFGGTLFRQVTSLWNANVNDGAQHTFGLNSEYESIPSPRQREAMANSEDVGQGGLFGSVVNYAASFFTVDKKEAEHLHTIIRKEAFKIVAQTDHDQTIARQELEAEEKDFCSITEVVDGEESARTSLNNVIINNAEERLRASQERRSLAMCQPEGDLHIAIMQWKTYLKEEGREEQIDDKLLALLSEFDKLEKLGSRVSNIIKQHFVVPQEVPELGTVPSQSHFHG